MKENHKYTNNCLFSIEAEQEGLKLTLNTLMHKCPALYLETVI